MESLYKLPLVLEPQPEGGYTVTCPLITELISEGDTVQEALSNVADALAAVLEAYEDLNRPLPPIMRQVLTDVPLYLSPCFHSLFVQCIGSRPSSTATMSFATRLMFRIACSV